MGSSLRTRGPIYVCGPWLVYVRHLVEALLCPFYFFFNSFTSICNPNTPFVIFALEHHCILLFIFILGSKTSFFIILTWIKNLMLSSSFAILIPYVGRGSTNKVVEWYNLLVPKTKAYIWEACFKPILSLLLKSLQVLLWCNASSRGGRILVIPSILLIGRWRWLPMTSTVWLALALKGPSLIWMACRASS